MWMVLICTGNVLRAWTLAGPMYGGGVGVKTHSAQK